MGVNPQRNTLIYPFKPVPVLEVSVTDRVWRLLAALAAGIPDEWRHIPTLRSGSYSTERNKLLDSLFCWTNRCLSQSELHRPAFTVVKSAPLCTSPNFLSASFPICCQLEQFVIFRLEVAFTASIWRGCMFLFSIHSFDKERFYFFVLS